MNWRTRSGSFGSLHEFWGRSDVAKKCNLLRMAVLKNGELILSEIGSALARAIGDDRWHENDLAVNRDRGRFRALALRRRLSEDAGRRAQVHTQKSEKLNRPSEVQMHGLEPSDELRLRHSNEILAHKPELLEN